MASGQVRPGVVSRYRRSVALASVPPPFTDCRLLPSKRSKQPISGPRGGYGTPCSSHTKPVSDRPGSCESERQGCPTSFRAMDGESGTGACFDRRSTIHHPAGRVFLRGRKWRPIAMLCVGDLMGVDSFRFNVWGFIERGDRRNDNGPSPKRSLREIYDNYLCDYSPAIWYI